MYHYFIHITKGNLLPIKLFNNTLLLLIYVPYLIQKKKNHVECGLLFELFSLGFLKKRKWARSKLNIFKCTHKVQFFQIIF